MPDARARLASVEIGGCGPVAVMGVINLSPESFHAGSVYRGDDAEANASICTAVANDLTLTALVDPTTPAYFEVVVDVHTLLPRSVRMTAAAAKGPVNDIERIEL